uniref:DUF148 domain-containing protein n=1 Tax=Caenorhabditis tropicalis TaxID=1561998 RepID=A0A1I7TCX6_9PELO
MSSFLKSIAFLALISFTNAGILNRSKRGSYGPPSNYSPPESQYGHGYGQNNGGGGYGRPSGYGGGGYNRPQQYGQGGYQQGGNGFQQGGFQGQNGGFQGQNGGFQGQNGGFQGQNGGFQGPGFQGDQSGQPGFQGPQTGFQASPPNPQPAPPVPQADDPNYSTVGQNAPVAAPGAGDSGLFGGGSASSGFDDPALAADAKPAKTTTDKVTETSGTASRK